MIRKNLLNWQHMGYSANHQNKTNLMIHVCTVPLFWLGVLAIPVSIFSGQVRFLLATPILVLGALVAQGIGHKKEEKSPEPFLSPMDFVSRFLVEQLVTFPRWMLGRALK